LTAPVGGRDLQDLARLLVETVESGAAVSFLAPLPMETALEWWRGVVAGIGRDRGPIVLVAREAGEIVGTVQLHPAWAPNQPHRGDVAKLMVAARAQRGGLGARLMEAVEDAARGAGLTLLTLDARSGGAAERLYRRTGWVCVGVIPRYAIDADRGGWHDTVVFYKAIGERSAVPDAR
jgi:GNAT superfamily N-acetyltransferase